jgi:hypothetical protein
LSRRRNALAEPARSIYRCGATRIILFRCGNRRNGSNNATSSSKERKHPMAIARQVIISLMKRQALLLGKSK